MRIVEPQLWHYSPKNDTSKPLRHWLLIQITLGMTAWAIVAMGILYLV